jgi:hypothetical protein
MEYAVWLQVLLIPETQPFNYLPSQIFKCDIDCFLNVLMLRTWVSGYSKYEHTLRSYHCCKELEHSSWCTAPLMQFGPPLNYLHIPECCFPICGPQVSCEWCMELSNDLYVFSSSIMFKWCRIAIGSETIIKWIEMYRDRGSSVSTVYMHQADSRNWLGSGSSRDFSILSSGCLEVKHLGCVVVSWPLFIVDGAMPVVHVEHEPWDVWRWHAHL